MSENAERPARSGRESGKKERPTASSALFPCAGFRYRFRFKLQFRRNKTIIAPQSYLEMIT